MNSLNWVLVLIFIEQFQSVWMDAMYPVKNSDSAFALQADIGLTVCQETLNTADSQQG